MIKQLLFSAAALGSAFAFEAYAEPVQYGNRDFYGFFLANVAYTNADESQYGFARQTFADPDQNELLLPFGVNMGVYAGTGVDGILYVAPYLFSSSLTMPEPMPLVSYNIYTGHYEEVGEWNPEKTDFKPQDMTYDITNDRMLALGYDSQNKSAIYEVNRKTAEFTLVNKLSVTAGTIACDAHGRVFVISNDGELYQVDITQDYRAEKLYQLPYKSMMGNQTMEFDHTCNKLYWASNCMENPNNDRTQSTWLVEISLPAIGPEQNYTAASGTYSYNQVGELGTAARFMGLYIPYCAGGFNAPGFATDIKAISSEDGSECTLSFKAPLKCFNGEDATTVDGYDIYREGVKIGSGKEFAADGTATFTDNTVPASGTYRYDIVCYSYTGGDGPKTPVYTYVGYDRPAAVAGIKFETSDDFKTVTLSWTAPSAGALGGTFYPEQTKYDVTRLPDNLTVATDITETTVTDTNIRRLLNYTYRITAKNAYGESTAASPVVLAGPAYTDADLPLEQDFEDLQSFNNRWTVSDNNADTFSWIFGSNLGHAIFGDYEMAAEYIISPTLQTAGLQDADDWVITPPVAFEAGKKYCVVCEVRAFSPYTENNQNKHRTEYFNIHVGSKPLVESMTKIGSFATLDPAYNEDGRMIFQKYLVEIPENIGGTTACVGVQYVSPIPDNLTSYVQLGAIRVGATSELGVGEIIGESENVTVAMTRSEIIISGEFNTAALYSINGSKVMDITSASTACDGLDSGIYILTVDGKSFKVAR